MYSHILVGSNDIARSKKFYDALFTAIGGKPGEDAAGPDCVYAQRRPLRGDRTQRWEASDGGQWRHNRL